jgi:hypothetical protein
MTYSELIEKGFQPVMEADLDSRRRVSLGKVGRPEHNRYQVLENPDGEIVLIPLVSIPARELIVWQNAQVRDSLARGIDQAAHGKVHPGGDFTQYLDD